MRLLHPQAYWLYQCLLALSVSSVQAISGNWILNSNGTWSTAVNWTSNPIIPGTAAGDVVSITNDISGNRNVTINTTSRTVGQLSLGDLNNTHSFTVRSTGGASLIFDNNGVGAVLNETGSRQDTISAPIILADDLLVTAAGSLTMSGSISESGTSARSLTKTGAGMLVLSGNNTFTGGINLNAGHLRIGNHANVLGSGVLTISSGTTISSLTSNQISTIANDQVWNGNFSINRGSGTTSSWNFNGGISLNNHTTITQAASRIHTHINGVITDGINSHALTIAAGTTGSVTITGANTYDGGTTLSSGLLNFKNATAIGTGAFTFGATGTSIDNTSGGALTLTNNNPFSVRSFTFLGTDDLFLGSGNMDLLGNTVITVNAKNLVFAGDIQASLSRLEKRGSGTFSLTSYNNAHTGRTNITAGVLEVSKMTNGGVNSSLGAQTNAASSLVFGSSAAVLRYVGNTNSSTNRSFTLSSGVGGGATIQSSGLGELSFTSGTLGYGTTNQTRILTLGGTNTGNNTFARTIANNGTGLTSLTKNDAGQWLITATNNTYTGMTNINAGSLIVNGNIAAGGSVIVANGATLGGTGTIAAATTIQSGASHSPGNGIGTQTFNGNLTYSAGSNFRWEIATASSTYDKVKVGGALSGSDATFHISSSTAFNTAFWSVNRAWSDVFTTLGGAPISFSGIFSSIAGADLTWDGSKAVSPSGSYFSLAGNTLQWTAIPEPTNLLVAVLFVMPFYRRKRPL